MYKVVMLPVAKQDIKEAAAWYNSKQQNLGRRFTSEIRRKVNYIKKTPLATATRYGEVKTAVLDNFPFIIHYSIENDKNLIIVIGVLHTSRNPDIWGKDR